jgi:hypothetical protein
MGLLSELALKLIYSMPEVSATEISQELHLPFAGVVSLVLELLDREKFVTIVGAQGFGEQAYRYSVTRMGIEAVHQILERNQYLGPAPVPLERYNGMIRAQAIGEVLLTEADVRAAFDGLIVSSDMFDRVGPALMSGQSAFLYGPPGNGKTTIATRMANLLATDPIYVPYAVSVGNHIITVFDDINHTQASNGSNPGQSLDWFEEAAFPKDERWVLIDRPHVMVGGELNLASLNLIWDPAVKYYEAPLQMKANGGMFFIDDFGRQQMDPQELLNRWIVPLETRVDFLSLHTGKKVEIPFEQLVVFSTNLDPAELVDEAFLRRIRHKIKVGNPTLDEFHQVFVNTCRENYVEFIESGFAHLVDEWYVKPQREFKNCHPRDIVGQMLDMARYKRIQPSTTPQMLDMACSAYFVDL